MYCVDKADLKMLGLQVCITVPTYLFFFDVVSCSKSKALYMLGKHSRTEIYPAHGCAL